MKHVVAAALLAGGAVRAALEWESTRQRLEVHPAQLSATAEFPFANSGDEPVAFDQIRVSCGCLAPELAKKTWAPGEQGNLAVEFDLRNRTGPQRKTVAVQTSDGQETRLRVECDIPVAFRIEPKMLRWKTGDPASTKTAKLLNPNKEPLRLLSAVSSHNALLARLKTLREGFEYEVVVTRRSASESARAVVRIQTGPPPGHSASKTLKLYVHAQ